MNNQQELKLKSDLHLSRKVWHCVGISAMAGIYNFLGPQASFWTLLIATCVILPLDFLRLKLPWLNQFTVGLFGSLMRRHEFHSLSGLSFLFLGSLFLLSFFDHHVITLTLLFLAFGDPIASFAGIRFGKDRLLGHKTLQGTMAAFVACTAVAGVYYHFNGLMTDRLLIVAPLSGLIGSVAELLPIGRLDDNLTFPIVGSLLLWLLFYVYGGFTF